MIDYLLDGFCWLFGRPLEWLETYVKTCNPRNPLRRGYFALVKWWDRQEEKGLREWRIEQAREVAEMNARHARTDAIMMDDAMRNRPTNPNEYH